MKISTTLFLAFLLTGLGAYYFVVEKPSEERSAGLGSLKILTLSEGDSPSWLQVQNPSSKQTITLRREGPDWSLEFPVSYPAENFLVKGMVNALLYSQRFRRFPIQGKAPKELGLDSPSLKIGIETEKNSRRRYLQMGENSPVGAGVYASWQGENEYFLISPEVKAAFERTVYSLRQKKLFRLRWDNVDWIEAKVGKEEYRLKKEGEKWRGLLPAAGEIPLEKASDLIYSFQSLYVKEFLDGKNPAKAEFGLKEKRDFLAAGGKGGREKLILGKPQKEKDAFHALREGENLVLLVSQPNVESLLEKFRETFQGLGDDGHQGKVAGDPKKDSGSLSKGGKKSGRGEACAGNEKCSGEPD